MGLSQDSQVQLFTGPTCKERIVIVKVDWKNKGKININEIWNKIILFALNKILSN